MTILYNDTGIGFFTTFANQTIPTDSNQEQQVKLIMDSQAGTMETVNYNIITLTQSLSPLEKSQTRKAILIKDDCQQINSVFYKNRFFHLDNSIEESNFFRMIEQIDDYQNHPEYHYLMDAGWKVRSNKQNTYWVPREHGEFVKQLIQQFPGYRYFDIRREGNRNRSRHTIEEITLVPKPGNQQLVKIVVEARERDNLFPSQTSVKTCLWNDLILDIPLRESLFAIYKQEETEKTISIGSWVRITKLRKHMNFNGRLGTVVSYSEETDSYQIILQMDGHCVEVFSKNVIPYFLKIQPVS